MSIQTIEVNYKTSCDGPDWTLFCNGHKGKCHLYQKEESFRRWYPKHTSFYKSLGTLYKVVGYQFVQNEWREFNPPE